MSCWPKFKAKVRRDSETGCWLWTGPITQHGHGNFRIGKTTMSAARWCWQYWCGELPKHLVVDHYLLNRVETAHLCARHCVSPFHLEPKTRRANFIESEFAMAGAEDRGRATGLRNRKQLPEGVTKDKGMHPRPYRAQFKGRDGEVVYVGSFHTPDAAHNAYMKAKAEHFIR